MTFHAPLNSRALTHAHTAASSLHSVCTFNPHTSVQTALKIVRDKSVGTMPMLPFASLVANCAIWTWYGALLNEGAGDTTVMLPNASGMCVGLLASAIYLKYSPSKQLPLVAGTIGIVGAVSAAAMTMPSAEVLPYIGYLGDLLAVVLMASPLSTMRSVIQEKSTRSMALPISVVRE